MKPKRQIITLDFETFYDREFSLSKLTTEEYVRDERFEVIGVAVKVNKEPTEWGSGSHKAIKEWLQSYDWENTILLCHNTAFDAFILSEIFDIHVRSYADTLSMARALLGPDARVSLAALARHYCIGEKGDEVHSAIGKRRADFTQEELNRYGDYCINDVDLTYQLFSTMIRDGFPKSEMKLIDLTLKMFVRPRLVLDVPMLESHYKDIIKKKEALLSEVDADKDELMSNSKFVDQLRSFGVEPPMKVSATTGKPTFALAKSDEGFKALAEHPDVRVQALVAARLGLKSTLEETRTERLIGVGTRGLMPVPLRYYAAHTGRWGGSDNLNFQNLPSRGENAGKIKNAIRAPEGYVLIEADSAQIEARVLAWLAEQKDLVTAFKEGRDVYKIMASAIYNKPEDQITKGERFVGKTTILGAGYGMSAAKFRAQLKTFGVEVSEEESQIIIRTYRETYPKIPMLWRTAQQVIDYMVKGGNVPIGPDGVVKVVAKNNAIRLPSGLHLQYPQLRAQYAGEKLEYAYKSRNGMTRIYGGKLVENLCQAVARCVIGEQMIKVAKKYEVVLTVHDSIVCMAPVGEAEEAAAFVEECMRWVPEWAAGLPVDCEAGYGESYGSC